MASSGLMVQAFEGREKVFYEGSWTKGRGSE